MSLTVFSSCLHFFFVTRDSQFPLSLPRKTSYSLFVSPVKHYPYPAYTVVVVVVVVVKAYLSGNGTRRLFFHSSPFVLSIFSSVSFSFILLPLASLILFCVYFVFSFLTYSSFSLYQLTGVYPEQFQFSSYP
jgi:hypothetical protein